MFMMVCVKLYPYIHIHVLELYIYIHVLELYLYIYPSIRTESLYIHVLEL